MIEGGERIDESMNYDMNFLSCLVLKKEKDWKKEKKEERDERKRGREEEKKIWKSEEEKEEETGIQYLKT